MTLPRVTHETLATSLQELLGPDSIKYKKIVLMRMLRDNPQLCAYLTEMTADFLESQNPDKNPVLAVLMYGLLTAQQDADHAEKKRKADQDYCRDRSRAEGSDSLDGGNTSDPCGPHAHDQVDRHQKNHGPARSQEAPG